MIVEGGEYIGENAAWSNQGAIYNPVANSWASVTPPRGWTNMGDAASDVLADGTFMLQQPCNTCLTNPDLTVDDALLNPRNLTWRVIPATGKTDHARWQHVRGRCGHKRAATADAVHR